MKNVTVLQTATGQQIVWENRTTKNIVVIPMSNILAMDVDTETANVITVHSMANRWQMTDCLVQVQTANHLPVRIVLRTASVAVMNAKVVIAVILP